MSNAIKLVLMGQGGVGKTAMVLRYTTGDFNEAYMPTSTLRIETRRALADAHESSLARSRAKTLPGPAPADARAPRRVRRGFAGERTLRSLASRARLR